jgi:hypothetical protein
LAAISAAGVDVNYVVTGQKKGGVSGDLAQAILSELHNRLWYTAQAIGELALLLDPADKRTPRDHIAEYLKFLNRNN